jgi:2-succinyl-5-enolpyruvyl-6-hydroxy-3-cyclohexene-1-carboxylate synthase
MARHRDVPQYAVAHPGRWPDPDLSATAILQGDATTVCASLLSMLGDYRNASNGWLRAWQGAETSTSGSIDAVLGETDEVSEVSAISDLAAIIPDGGYLFAGNSMPVRDIDGFFATRDKHVTLLGSRGASGIDGVVSTALGVAARTGAPTALLIGDLSFYHDMNGLLAAQRHGLNATIVLINNDGGGIFSFLPQHEQSEDFELLFGTPHGLDYSHVAPLYGVGFQRVATREDYREALRSSFLSPGVQVIEVRTDREENLRLHQRIWAAVAEAVTPVLTHEAPAS